MMMKKKNTKTMAHDVEKNLRNIYANSDGEIPDLTKLEYRRTSKITRLLVRTILLLVVISAVAWGGFFLWRPFGLQTNRPLSAMIEGAATATAGETITYRITYENTSNVPLAALEVKMNLPADFLVDETRPVSTEGSVWVIGSLAPGSDGSIDITGTFRSVVPSMEKLQAFFTYRPANFSSDFQDIASLSIGVEKTVLELTTTGPEKALPGDQIAYTAHLVNNGSRRMDNLEVRAIFPDTFRHTEATKAASNEGGTSWTIDSLEPGAAFDLTVKGSFTTGASGTVTALFEAGLLDLDDLFLSQAPSTVTTDLLGGNLAVRLIANGSDKEQSIDLGENLRISVDYENQGDEVIEGVSITLKLETPTNSLPIDWASAERSGAKTQGNTLVWDASVLPALESLAPNASGIIDVTLPLLSSIDPAVSSDTFTLALTVLLEKVGSVESVRTIETPPIEIRLNTDASFAATARYFAEDGTALGSGPLPPTVDQTTTYRIFWDLQNSIHDLKNISVTTNLPPDVAWVGRAQADIGSIVYNETTRLVTWTIDILPTSLTAAEAWFDLAITPDASDVGAFVKLTNVTAFEGTDASTDDTVHTSTNVLDTELPDDALAAGKGVVTE